MALKQTAIKHENCEQRISRAYYDGVVSGIMGSVFSLLMCGMVVGILKALYG